MQETQDFLYAKGSVEIIKTGPDGTVEKRHIPNLVVGVGKEHIADRMSANTTNVMRAIAIGTGNVAAAFSQTTLQGTELARAATAVGGVRTGNSILYSATFPAGTGTGTLAEAGVFNNTSSGGVMLCRTRFNEINKAAGDALDINWTVQIT